MDNDDYKNRIIGEFTSGKPGPLMIVLAAIHGNEIAGVEAIRLVLKMIEVEPITNPLFDFRGKLLGLIGNFRAYKKGVRFIDADLNRIWKKERIDKIQRNGSAKNTEESEMLMLLKLIRSEIENTQPERVVFLDLHTTSSGGGIFSIPGNTEEGLRIATKLHAPVIKGMMDVVSGTTMHFLNKENLGVETHGVIFESGHHEDPLSVNRAISGTINCLRTVGCVKEKDVENIHDRILIEYSQKLPTVSQLLYKYDIKSNDDFEMVPGYNNFQEVKEGEKVGKNKLGSIYSPVSGRILMPLYQDLGNEGFYIVKESE